jgi:hypothetical protein
MVKLVVFLPHDNSLSCLGHLHGTIRVIQSSDFLCGATELLLVSDNDFSLRILVDYNDVIFKFECFCLEAEVVSQNLWRNSREVTKIEGWQYIKCMFRFEWERPALSGEVPVHWEQIVRRRGKRQDISDTATDVGVSMIGIALWNSAENSPIALILSDDVDPATLRVCTKKDEITSFISECECVDLNNVKLWATKLVDNR